MTECLFCKIGDKTIASEVIYESAATIAFLDIHPCAPGHTVVIPKMHTETLLHIADENMGLLWSSVKKVMTILTDTLRPDGFTVGINQGKAAGQAVDHVHVHIIPRWRDDGGKSIHAVVQNPSSESPAIIAEKIRKSQK